MTVLFETSSLSKNVLSCSKCPHFPKILHIYNNVITFQNCPNFPKMFTLFLNNCTFKKIS